MFSLGGSEQMMYVTKCYTFHNSCRKSRKELTFLADALLLAWVWALSLLLAWVQALSLLLARVWTLSLLLAGVRALSLLLTGVRALRLLLAGVRALRLLLAMGFSSFNSRHGLVVVLWSFIFWNGEDSEWFAGRT